MIDKGLYKKPPAAKSQLVYKSDKRLGYRGPGEYQGGRGYGGSKSTSGSSSKNTSGSGNIGGGGGKDRFDPPPVRTTPPSNIPTSDNKTRTVSTDPMDIREQYRIGNPAINTSLNAPFSPVTPMVSFDDPFRSQALETQRYNNIVDARNLANMNYPGSNVRLPAFVPYSTLINTGIGFLDNLIGGKSFEKNTKFFAENVAGNYGYGYSYEDYQQYMKDRMAGKVSAYGNPALGQNEINRRSDDGGGIMQVRQINPLIPIEDEEENQTAKNYDFNYGTASNPIYYSDLV